MGFQIESGVDVQPRSPEGSVHGRFQPFHLEHFEYVMEAKKRCDFLWIGITRFDVAAPGITRLGTHRDEPENNPLTYYERVKTITMSLDDAGVARNEYAFVPFPIETPASLKGFLPTTVRCFTTICEDWNRKKIAVLEGAGYVVQVLWERDKKITGTDVRNLLAAGDERWRDLVPPGTARALAEFDIADRLRQLRAVP